MLGKHGPQPHSQQTHAEEAREYRGTGDDWFHTCLQTRRGHLPCGRPIGSADYFSKAKIRFQSSFMLMITHPSFFASSYSAWEKAPTLVSGRPAAGP